MLTRQAGGAGGGALALCPALPGAQQGSAIPRLEGDSGQVGTLPLLLQNLPSRAQISRERGVCVTE